jgi:hypothetical protein
LSKSFGNDIAKDKHRKDREIKEKYKNFKGEKEIMDQKVGVEVIQLKTGESVKAEKQKKVRKPREVKAFEGVTKEEFKEFKEFKVELFKWLKEELSSNEYRLYKGIRTQQANKEGEILMQLDTLEGKIDSLLQKGEQ